MNKLKETLKRAITWAKAHPIPAALIVIVLALVGFFIYKATRGSGESSSSDSSVGIPDSLAGGGTLSGGGDSIMDTVGVAPPPAVITGDPFGPGSGGGSGGGGGGGDGGSLDAFIPIPAATPPAFDLTTSTPTFGMADTTQSAIIGYSKGGMAKTEKTQAVEQMKVAKVKAPKVQATTSKNIDTSGWSPARLLGKGQNFTGYIGIAFYVNGYPQSVGQQAMKNVGLVTKVPVLATSKQPASAKPKPLKKAK